MTAPTLILCLGNEILSDDGLGAVVAHRLQEREFASDKIEVIFAARAGFALLDLLQDRRRVLIIDSIQLRQGVPGTLYRFPMGVFTPSRNLTTSHQISLPTALELGRKVGLRMPDTIDVLAVEAEDVETLQESLTPAVAAAVEDVIAAAEQWLVDEPEENTHAREHSGEAGSG